MRKLPTRSTPRTELGSELLTILGHAESVLQGHRNYAYTLLGLLAASQLVIIADISNKGDDIIKNMKITIETFPFFSNITIITFLKIIVLAFVSWITLKSISRFRKNIYRFNMRVNLVEKMIYFHEVNVWDMIMEDLNVISKFGAYPLLRFIMNKFDYEDSLSFRKNVFVSSKFRARYHLEWSAFKTSSEFKSRGVYWSDDEKAKIDRETHDLALRLQVIEDTNEDIFSRNHDYSTLSRDGIKKYRNTDRFSFSDKFLGFEIFNLFTVVTLHSAIFCVYFFALLIFNYYCLT